MLPHLDPAGALDLLQRLQVARRAWTCNKLQDVGVSVGLSKNGVFVRENPIKMDDFGVPPFMEPPM